MNDKNTRAEELANKLFNKTITPEEEQELNSWYNRHLDDQVEIPQGFAASEEEHRERILEAIREGIGKRKVVRLWPRIVVAAAAVAAIVFGVYFFNPSRQSRLDVGNTGSAQYANDVAPGKNGATIKLASGKVIQLSGAKAGVVIGDDMKYNDGTALSGLQPSLPEGERSKVQNLTASTARGQTYQFTLPDGTRVWLNAESKISFPSQFNGKERKILLEGEGYFEVAKDKAHPFIVETDLQNIEVLGTHFNINSYADEPDTKTTLLEGSVQVTPKQASAKARVMKPGQQAILDKRFDIQLEEVLDLESIIAWRAAGGDDPGSLVFENDALDEVMRRISRWYDVTVEYRGSVKKDIRFSGVVRRDVPLSRVIELLETTQSIEFKIEGRRLIVMN